MDRISRFSGSVNTTVLLLTRHPDFFAAFRWLVKFDNVERTEDPNGFWPKT